MAEMRMCKYGGVGGERGSYQYCMEPSVTGSSAKDKWGNCLLKHGGSKFEIQYGHCGSLLPALR